MKKAIFCFFAMILLLSACSSTKENTTRTITIKTSDSDINLNVELADSPNKITKGLMFRQSLGKDEGMLFIFPDEAYRSFWMKNTLIPLDMLFISGNGTIVDMKESFQPCKTDFCGSYKSKEKAKYVIEVNAGFAEENNIKEGNFAVI